jgi:ABC-2 type transport system ATP-binding protein
LIDTRDRKASAGFLTSKGFSVGLERNGILSLKDQAAIGKPEEVNRLLVQAGFPPHLLYVEQEDLETYFLRTIGESK